MPVGRVDGLGSAGWFLCGCHVARALILDEIVSEDAVSAPVSGAVDAGEFGAVPAVAAFEVDDPSFGSGAPFDLVAEGAPMFERAAGGWV
jgi:hypothetical protein